MKEKSNSTVTYVINLEKDPGLAAMHDMAENMYHALYNLQQEIRKYIKYTDENEHTKGMEMAQNMLRYTMEDYHVDLDRVE